MATPKSTTMTIYDSTRPLMGQLDEINTVELSPPLLQGVNYTLLKFKPLATKKGVFDISFESFPWVCRFKEKNAPLICMDKTIIWFKDSNNTSDTNKIQEEIISGILKSNNNDHYLVWLHQDQGPLIEQVEERELLKSEEKSEKQEETQDQSTNYRVEAVDKFFKKILSSLSKSK